MNPVAEEEEAREDRSSSDGPTRADIYRYVLIFAVSFVAGMALLRPSTPTPLRLAEKLDALHANPDVNMVFVGSSRTHFNVRPEVFDAEATRLGIPATSYNLGIPGAAGHEIDYILERYVLPLPNIKTVFVELPGFEYQMTDKDERTFRKIYWHDPRRTIGAVKTSLKGPIPEGLRWAEAEDHLFHFILWFCGLWPERDAPSLFAGPDGYAPWGTRMEEREYHRGELASRGFLHSTSYVINRDVILRQQAALAARGIETIYLMPPAAPDYAPLLEMAERGEIKLFKINDPRDYPELYRSDTNAGYLLRKGAGLYSEILARQFAELHDAAPPQEEPAPNSTTHAGY